jgi:hypothetical protein
LFSGPDDFALSDSVPFVFQDYFCLSERDSDAVLGKTFHGLLKQITPERYRGQSIDAPNVEREHHA